MLFWNASMKAPMPKSRLTMAARLSLNRYIYWSTMFGIFSGALNIYIGSTIFIFYFVMVSNLLLIWAFIRPLSFPKWVGWFVLYLLGSGLIGILRGTDTPLLVAKQLAAISLSVWYFANFFRLHDDVDSAWLTYVKIAYWLTLVALVMWPIECWAGRGFVRLHGLASEPSGYCVLTLPAYYWFAYQWLSNGRHLKEVLWITLGVGLAASSTGYVAVLLGVILLFGKRRTSIAIVTALVCLFGLGLYVVSPYFSVRVDDTLGSLASSDVSGTNLSTYALISNMFVTERVLAVHPLLGNGLGSHFLSNQRYIEDVPGEDLVEASGGNGGTVGANLQDASSLTLRSLSELGIVGFATILWFVFHFRVGGTGARAAISCAILTVFFQKLFRGGGYSNPEQFFFIMVYLLNYRQFKKEENGVGKTRTRQAAIPAS
jgi:hypothetical protein